MPEKNASLQAIEDAIAEVRAERIELQIQEKTLMDAYEIVKARAEDEAEA